MPTLKKIIIHAGLAKTGSSYIQNSLHILERSNAFSNVCYPSNKEEQDFQHIASGNGARIGILLKPDITCEFLKDEIMAEFENLLKQMSSSKKIMLISSEMFAKAEPKRFNFLLEYMGNYCNNIQVFVFVRSFVPWTWSVYQQLIKRSSLHLGYKEWLDKYLLDFVSAAAINILSFNSQLKMLKFSKNNLLENLLTECGEKTELSKRLPKDKVNRSLSKLEFDMMLTVNKIFNDMEASTLITDEFIRRSPNIKSTYMPQNLNIHAMNAYKNIRMDLKRIGTDEALHMMHLLNGKDSDSNVNESHSYDNEHYEKEFNELLGIILKVIHGRYSSLSHLYRTAKYLEESRDYFDPIHYLLINPDLLSQNIEPLKHFKKTGKSEMRFTCYK